MFGAAILGATEFADILELTGTPTALLDGIKLYATTSVTSIIIVPTILAESITLEP